MSRSWLTRSGARGRVPGSSLRAASGLRSASGFSLVELMVAVAVVGIITAIALPSYRSYVLRGNRTDAIRTLSYYQQALERCYSQNFSYLNSGTTPCPAAPGTPTASTNGYYNITFTIPAANQYTIVAVPKPGTPQTKDTQCASMQVSQNGAQSATDTAGGDTTQTCWGGK